jgi:hypothetical protein
VRKQPKTKQGITHLFGSSSLFLHCDDLESSRRSFASAMSHRNSSAPKDEEELVPVCDVCPPEQDC